MNSLKVLVVHPNVPKIAIETLQRAVQVIVPKEYSRNAILENICGVNGVFWFGYQKVDKEVLDKAGPKLKVVGCMSAGLDHVDIDELKRRGILLSNTPRVLDDAVADIAVFLALGASRRVNEMHLLMKTGEWNKAEYGLDIHGSTVGIVGLGGIGQATVKKLKVFNVAKFLYTGHRPKKEGEELGAIFVNFDTLIKESDFIIIACPLTTETKHLFNVDAFKKMKNTSILVNIARGDIIEQDALVWALKTGEIFAAGLDVMTPEPLPPNHELLKLPNAFLLPHIGSATIKTRNEMAKLAANNILRALGGEEMLTPVC